MVLLCRCSYKQYMILLVLLLHLVGCGGKFNYQVRVEDSSGLPIKNAHVELAVGGSFATLSNYTDNNGYALIEVDGSRAGKQALLRVSVDGYGTYSQYVNLDKDTLPSFIMLAKPGSSGPLPPAPVAANPVTPTSAVTLPPTDTPVPVVPPTDTMTPSPLPPTFTATSTNTPSPTPTDTPRPIVVTGSVQVQAIQDGMFVYAGPDSGQPHMGVLRLRETADIIGKTQQGEWLEVITSRGIEGWIDPQFVELVTGSLDQVPVTWSGAVTPPTTATSVVQPSCVTVTVSKRDVPLKAFDDVTLSWNNAPSGTARLWLSVYVPQADGSKTYAVYPTYSDLITPYIIHEWVFADRHFAPNTTFTYAVEAQDAGGNRICTTTGAFVP